MIRASDYIHSIQKVLGSIPSWVPFFLFVFFGEGEDFFSLSESLSSLECIFVVWCTVVWITACSLEARSSSPRFYLTALEKNHVSPILLQGCEIESGGGRHGLEATLHDAAMWL